MPAKGNRRGIVLIAIGLSVTLCLALVLFFHLPPHSDIDASSALKGRLDEFLVGKENDILTLSNDAPQRHEKKIQPPPILKPEQWVKHQDVVSRLENDKPKLQSALDQIYIETGKAYQGDLWEVSHLIPHWMKGEPLLCSSNDIVEIGLEASRN
jgi:hypothetical protein